MALSEKRAPTGASGAASSESFGYFRWGTAASVSVQRPSSTSEKSMAALSDRPSARSRFRRVMSQSSARVVWPMAASASDTQAVKDVLPVPPLPDTTAMILPMRVLLS